MLNAKTWTFNAAVTRPTTTPQSIMNASRPALLSCAFALFASATPTHAQLSVEWITQYGSSEADLGRGIAVDALGRSWVTGWTYGNISGDFMGGTDVFLSRLSASGTVEFTHQRGGTGFDAAQSVVLVGNNTVFIGGNTNSSTFDGIANLGSSDALMVRYDTNGTWQGTMCFGGRSSEVLYSLAANATQVLAAGFTFSPFDGQSTIGTGDTLLTKRDSSGDLVWTRFAGTTSSDYALAAAFDNAGNAYFAGETGGSFSGFTNAGNSDLLIARYDIYGNRTLLKQFGSSGGEYPTDMEVDGEGNIYLVGDTWGPLDGQINGLQDAFLMKLDSAGNVLWTRLFGGSNFDYGSGVGLDGAGHVWISGTSSSTSGGQPNAIKPGAFVAEYDTDGNLLDTIFLNDSGGDRISGLAIGPDGAAYVTGDTTGVLGTTSAGGRDIFVAKIVPEPCTALLAASGILLLQRRRQWH